MFCTLCLAVFPTHFGQLDLNPANLEATVEAEWILAFLFLRKRNFSMMSHFTSSLPSSLRSVVQVLMGHFTIYQSHVLSGCFVPKIMKSCLYLSKLRQKYCWSFFQTRSSYFCTVFIALSYAKAQLSYRRPVHPSVCPSVTQRYWVKTSGHRIIRFSPSVIQGLACSFSARSLGYSIARASSETGESKIV